MIHRVLLILGISITAVIMFANPVSARDLEYIWNGNESIIATGGPFDALESQKTTEDDDAAAGIFNLQRTSVGAAEYKGSGLGIELVGQSIAGVGGKCIIDTATIYVDYSTSPMRVVKIVANEAHAVADDAGSIIGIDLVAWARNSLDACKSGFNGALMPGNGLQTSYNDALEGTRGQNPIIYRFETQLNKMFDREKKRYIDRTCSQSKPTPECTQSVNKAYANIWDTCRHMTLVEGLLMENSVGVGYQEDAGVDAVNFFKDCIKEYSGLGINESLLRNNVALDLVEAANKSTCSIPYIGFVVCPLSRFMGVMVDQAFEAFKRFFEIAPLDRGTDAGDLLFKTWAVMRNFANVAFAILFILIVIAQITNYGISNYSIKKLLPKLILMAILVNISYYLCVIAVDISNIMGSSLIDVFELLKPTVEIQNTTWTDLMESILVSSAVLTGVGIVVATGSFVAMFPLLVGAAISLLVAVILIMARYGIILALTIVSPLALACLLLPNTQQWFDKWRSLFVTMLMLYPIISIVFGASTTASLIIMNSSLSNPGGGITLQLFGLAIQFIPLAITPLILKFGGNLLAQVGNKASRSGVFKPIRDKTDNFVKRRKNARDVKALRSTGDKQRGGIKGLRDGFIQRSYRRTGIRKMRQGEYNRAQASYISGYTSGKAGYGGDKRSWVTPWKTKGSRYAGSLAAGGGNIGDVRADALNAQANLTAQEATAQKFKLQNSGMSLDAITDTANSPATDEAMRLAAIEIVKESGIPDNIHQLVKSSGKGTTAQQRHAIAGAAARTSPMYATPEAQQAILSGSIQDQASYQSQIVAPAVQQGIFSAETLGASDKGTIDEIHKVISSGEGVSSESAARMRGIAQETLANPEHLSRGHASAVSRNSIENIAAGRSYRPNR